MNFWGNPESNRNASAAALSQFPHIPAFRGYRSPCTKYGRGSSNRHIFKHKYGVQARTDFECPHSVGFLRCSLPCTITQGAPCPGFVYRIRQAVCKLRACLCTSTSDAGISAPRWAQIGNTCVSFHAVSIHTEGSAPRLFCPAVLMRTLGHVLRALVCSITHAGNTIICSTFRSWSQQRESNSHIQLGRLTFCH